MKILALALSVLILASGCAHFTKAAGRVCNGGWSETDTKLQAASTGLLLIDASQTRGIAANGDKFYERNPILGAHPSMGFVNSYFGIAIPGHFVVSCILPPKARRVWQVGTIAVETGMVVNNLAVGIPLR